VSELRKEIRTVLLKHKPVNVHFSVMEFESNPTQCTCGEFLLSGAMFEDHWAGVIEEVVER
jgi:hypothetical protein